jgi:hypothetical protein
VHIINFLVIVVSVVAMVMTMVVAVVVVMVVVVVVVVVVTMSIIRHRNVLIIFLAEPICKPATTTPARRQFLLSDPRSQA